MSGDVFSAIDPNESKPVVFKRHCHLSFPIELYCSYNGKCEVDRVINRELVCIMCMYKRPLDIPEMIRKELEK